MAEILDLLDEVLAGLVGRMGLAGEDELHGALRIVDQFGQDIELAEEQIGALVGGEAAGETDRQRVGVEDVAGGFDDFIGFVAAASLAADAAADEVEQAVLEIAVRFPQFARVDVVERLPNLGVAHPLLPIAAEHAVVEQVHRVGEPGGNVNAVGDVADGDFFFDAPRPEVGPHAAGDVAVQSADGVGAARELEADDRHAERFVFVLRFDAAEAHELCGRDAELVAKRAEMFFDEVRGEPVVAGGHGRVGGEDGVMGDFAEGFVEREAVVGHALANDFERGEGAVAFVQVVDARHDAERAKRFDAADAEHEFLADAGAHVAAVEARGEVAILQAVAFDIAIEQVQRHAADLHQPDFGHEAAVAGFDGDGDLLAVDADGGLHRQIFDPRVHVFFLLEAAAIELLLEIALVVEQTNRHERHGEAACAFDMVAGKNAEAAGVDRDGFVNAELGGEVGDGSRAEDARFARAPGFAGVVHVVFEPPMGLIDAACRAPFRRRARQAGRASFRRAGRSGYGRSCAI